MIICQSCNTLHSYTSFICPSCGFQPEVACGIPVFAADLIKMNSGFNKDLFATIFNFEKKHFWFRSRNMLLQESLQLYFPSTRNYCEIGCGTGFVLSAVSQANSGMVVTGSEIYLDALEYAARRVPGARFLQADICRFPFESEFDLIGAFDVLEHIEDDKTALRNIHRALRKNGGLLLTVPQHKWLWSDFDQLSCHKRRYNRKDLISKIRETGFKIIRITSFMTFLLPIMILSRLGKRDPGEIGLRFSIPEYANALFLNINKMENFLIRKGIDFPAGGSLLCIAQKSDSI